MVKIQKKILDSDRDPDAFQNEVFFESPAMAPATGQYAGASTPYKRWSKCTMEKVGGSVLQKLRGEVHQLLMHFPLSFCKNAET